METVFGMKDVFPHEVRIKREIERSLRRVFQGWGYEEVETPSIELFKTFSPAMEDEESERLYRFINREGKLACLRPEFTTSVARMFSGKAAREFTNTRVFYDGKIFRLPTSPFRSETELTQLGLENFGQSDPFIDAEIIALAALSLREAGIREYELDIAHVGFVHYLLDTLAVTDETKRCLKRSIRARDFNAVKEVLQGSRLDLDRVSLSVLEQLPFLRGKRAELESLRNNFPENSLFFTCAGHLIQVWDMLEDMDVTEGVFFNLGLIRDFEYYTGVIFEGFSPYEGSPVLTGGRYDGLFHRFGRECPACGFALFVERLVEVLQKSGIHSSGEPSLLKILYAPADRREVFQQAEIARARGIPVIMEEDPYASHPRIFLEGEECTFSPPLSAGDMIQKWEKRQNRG